MVTSIKRILSRIRSSKIQNRIASGKIVYFEIDSDSTSVLMGVMEGRQISKERYDNFHLIEGVVWNRKIIPATYKSVGT
jgi:hypothetical protein